MTVREPELLLCLLVNFSSVASGRIIELPNYISGPFLVDYVEVEEKFRCFWPDRRRPDFDRLEPSGTISPKASRATFVTPDDKFCSVLSVINNISASSGRLQDEQRCRRRIPRHPSPPAHRGGCQDTPARGQAQSQQAQLPGPQLRHLPRRARKHVLHGLVLSQILLPVPQRVVKGESWLLFSSWSLYADSLSLRSNRTAVENVLLDAKITLE